MSDTNKLDIIYEELKKSFLTTNKDKILLVKKLIEICTDLNGDEIFLLKKRMDIYFEKECKCYKGLGSFSSTDINYGCDLRNILYNLNNELITDDENDSIGQRLLDIFFEKSQDIEQQWHILTDIDDTLYPNTEHGTNLSGSDVSWKQKTPYPGIVSFYDNFYNTFSNDAFKYTTVLSATPGFLKETRANKQILKDIIGENYAFIQGEESRSTLIKRYSQGMSQEVFNGAKGMFEGVRNNLGNYIPDHKQYTYLGGHNNKPSFAPHIHFGDKKYERFTQYVTLFPEYKYIFIGDNGQGDLYAAEKMAEYSLQNDITLFSFIHNVYNGIQWKESNTTISNISFFKNYKELSNIFHHQLKIFNETQNYEIAKIFDHEMKINPEYNLYNSIHGGYRKYRGRKTIKRNSKSRINYKRVTKKHKRTLSHIKRRKLKKTKKKRKMISKN